MELIRYNTPLPGSGGSALALGYFDGVHIGHRAVVQAMLAEAGAAGLTPAVFTYTLGEGEGSKGRRLQSAAGKNAALAGLGVQVCFEPPFAEFCALAPDVFFNEKVRGQYRAKVLLCGEDFGFGAARAGNVETLRAMCDGAGMKLIVVPTTFWQGEAVSSSRVRERLAAGDIEAANAMLGRPYSITLPVQHGRGIGSKMGFPTINQLYPAWMQPPAQGVYITEAVVEGKTYPAATGYGTRPTVQGKRVTCETFIPGFAGDVYGEEVEVRFYKKIDDSQRFAGKEELNAAVHQWAAVSLAFFAAGGAEKPL